MADAGGRQTTRDVTGPLVHSAQVCRTGWSGSPVTMPLKLHRALKYIVSVNWLTAIPLAPARRARFARIGGAAEARPPPAPAGADGDVEEPLVFTSDDPARSNRSEEPSVSDGPTVQTSLRPTTAAAGGAVVTFACLPVGTKPHPVCNRKLRLTSEFALARREIESPP